MQIAKRFLYCDTQAVALFTDPHKGIMTPPLLVDITHDGVDDIIINTFNSTTMLIDGDTFEILWNFTYKGAETYAYEYKLSCAF